MSKIDWSKAPEGAEFYAYGAFRKENESGDVEAWLGDAGWWCLGMTHEELKERLDYEKRPAEQNAPESTQGDLNAKPVSKYHRVIKGAQVDLYDVLVAYGVTCPALAHALKKMLMPGQRHAKTFEQDIDEAIASLQRAKELRE